MRNIFPFINVYKKMTTESGIVTQLLYGDSFSKLRRKGKWIQIKNNMDNYKGYIQNKNFSSDQKNTHKVCSLFAVLYSKPEKKYKINKKLSYGSKIKIIQKKNGFCKFDNFWIHKKDIKNKKISFKNPFEDIKKFINVKYKWGGKFFNGIDCSGLVQVLLNYNNKFCPRDAKDQMKYYKHEIKLKNIRKNDLIFWKGHVAIVISKKNLVHAYGPLKKVLIMPINKTINRIYKTANLKVLSIKRI